MTPEQRAHHQLVQAGAVLAPYPPPHGHRWPAVFSQRLVRWSTDSARRFYATRAAGDREREAQG